MQLNPSEISELIKGKIENLDTGAEVRTQGTVVSITDGICRIHGLSDAMQKPGCAVYPRGSVGFRSELTSALAPAWATRMPNRRWPVWW